MAAIRYSGNLIMRVTVDREKSTYKVSLSVHGHHIRTVNDIIFPLHLINPVKIDDPNMIDKAALTALDHAQFELYAYAADLEKNKDGKIIIRRKPLGESKNKKSSKDDN